MQHSSCWTPGAAGQNKQHLVTKNTAKLDRETEELHHERVPLEVGKVIQQGRQAKGLTQKDLATVSTHTSWCLHDEYSLVLPLQTHRSLVVMQSHFCADFSFYYYSLLFLLNLCFCVLHPWLAADLVDQFPSCHVSCTDSVCQIFYRDQIFGFIL